MKVDAYRTEHVEVELTPHSIKEVTRDNILKHFNLPKSPEIKNGQLYEVWEQNWGSHSSFEEELVREATEDDIAAVRVLQSMGLIR